jgi:pimeloyl-ACP methyl ester carboxylesterase
LYCHRVIPRPESRARGTATSVDGTDIAWYRYGEGEPTILFVPTWNIVDARVWGNQVEALSLDATVLTYDPRGAGASGRPERGYDFPFHAADARAVLDANEIRSVSLVTASRSVNTAALLITADPRRFERLAAIAPYVEFELDPAWPDPAVLERWRTDWAGFVVPFMHTVFTEPDSAELIDEVVAIALEATPDVIVTQEFEFDWVRPARLLSSVACPCLLIHGESDATTPTALVTKIVNALPNARLELIAGGGHRPDVRSPELVNPLLAHFLLAP